MKTTAKKLLALLLAAALCISAVPAGTLKADAASGEIYPVTVTVTYRQSEARTMLDMVNELRTGEDAWALDSNEDVVTYSNLSELEYDFELEKIAMQRAAEIALYFDHTRTDGTMYSTAYEEAGYSCWTMGENIAAGYTSAESAFEGWCETNESYANQGHRRSMLSSGYNRIGIACVKYQGVYYWVQEFAYSTGENTETTANDSATDVNVNILSDYIEDSEAEFSVESCTLVLGDTVDLPEMVSFKLLMSEGWPENSYKKVVSAFTWDSEDNSKIEINMEDGTLTAVGAGLTALDADTISGTYFIFVTIYNLEFVWDGTECTAVFTNPDYDPNDPTSIEKYEIACDVFYDGSEATCMDDGAGVYVASCSFGDSRNTYTDTLEVRFPATGHSFNDGEIVEEATCTEEGEILYTCTTCGNTYTVAIPAKGHDWSEPEWSWTEDGTIATAIFTCENDETEVERIATETDAAILQKLGCETEGIVEYTATVIFDGETYTDTKTVITAATGHSYDDGWVSIEPTCTEEGRMIYTCITCGEILAETIPATGHSYRETERIEPTCTRDGRIAYTCENCGIIYTEPLAATGHIPDEGIVTKEATCTENGEITYTCSVCGEKWTETIPMAGHNYEQTAYEGPTCTEEGSGTFVCSICGDTEVTIMPSTGHTILHVEAEEATETEDGNIEYWYCSVCGKYFADEALTTEITEADTVIAATGNTPEKSTSENEGSSAETGESTNENNSGSSEETGTEENSSNSGEEIGAEGRDDTTIEATETAATDTDAGTGESSNEAISANTSAADIPETSDSAQVYFWMLLLAIAATGVYVLTGYERKKNHMEI